MKLMKLPDFTKGWIVGDFEPNIIKTKDFEVAVKEYKSGDREPAHIHNVAKEITIIVAGRFQMNKQVLNKGDIVYLVPSESANFECLEEGSTTVIKIPSVAGDKYLL